MVDLEKINQNMEQLPAKIARAAEQIAEAEEKVKLHKNAITGMKAIAILAYTKENPKPVPNATVLNAYADSKTRELQDELVVLEAELAKLKVEKEFYENEFDAARKIANVYIEESRRSAPITRGQL